MVSSIENVQQDVNHHEIIKSTFSIRGMTCSSCSNAIQTALGDLTGIRKVNIDVIGNSAVIEHDGSLVVSDIINTIESVGYDATQVSSILKGDDQNTTR